MFAFPPKEKKPINATRSTPMWKLRPLDQLTAGTSSDWGPELQWRPVCRDNWSGGEGFPGAEPLIYHWADLNAQISPTNQVQVQEFLEAAREKAGVHEVGFQQIALNEILVEEDCEDCVLLTDLPLVGYGTMVLLLDTTDGSVWRVAYDWCRARFAPTLQMALGRLPDAAT
eukprot:TRINITY_DN15003_c0_g1_i1.p1 TRINITY_DN15003_c0_g1~~TRINITY_DN15003_c0_g1_i1.p1  ORF type:complete len:171 (-),score=9.57 TRINITY_DN15003_c0_g1_i1:131-643(-)